MEIRKAGLVADLKPIEYTNERIVVQDVEIIVHTLMGEFISWYCDFGYIKYEPEDAMSGSARVNALGFNIPEAFSGDTNWDVGFACVSDF